MVTVVKPEMVVPLPLGLGRYW